MLEGALTVGAIGIVTAIIGKLKWYVKKNGKWTFGCGFMDKPLIDDDEIEIHTEQLGNVHVVYLTPKHHAPVENSDDE
jgi:hypothetical protein